MDTKQSFEQLQNLESNMKTKKNVNFNNTNDSVFVDEPLFNTGNFGDNQLNIKNKNNNISNKLSSSNKNKIENKNESD